jgi:hypothetical protein
VAKLTVLLSPLSPSPLAAGVTPEQALALTTIAAQAIAVLIMFFKEVS